MNNIIINTPGKIDDSVISLSRSPIQDIQFSALDYDTITRAIYEYIKTYYPNDFDNFTPNDGLVMFIEIVSSIADKLSLRNDLNMREAIWKTASSVEATSKLMEMIGEKFKNRSSAVVEIECKLESPLDFDLMLGPGITVSTNGPNGNKIYYEVYKGPDDYTSQILIPAGKLGVVAWGIEGQRNATYIRNSTGGVGQSYKIVQQNVLTNGLQVYVTRGNIRNDYLIYEGPTDPTPSNVRSVELRKYIGVDGRDIVEVIFPDTIDKGRPSQGDIINISYRTGGGTGGRILAGQINQTASVRHAKGTTRVNFRNAVPSFGGSEDESVTDAKKRASESFSRHGCIVSTTDYMTFSNGFSKAGYGNISKTSVVVDNNIVYLYVIGNGVNDLPSLVSVELKDALKTAISSINPVTNTVVVSDGILKPINIDVSLVLNQSSSAENARLKAEEIIRNTFSVNFNNMGNPFHISTLIADLRQIPDVRYVDIIEPTSNISQVNMVGISSRDTVSLNEILTIGSMKVSCSYI